VLSIIHESKARGRGRVVRGRGRDERSSGTEPITMMRRKHREEFPTCYFCEKYGHIIKNCEKYKSAKSTACAKG